MVNKSELIDAIAADAGLSKADAGKRWMRRCQRSLAL